MELAQQAIQAGDFGVQFGDVSLFILQRGFIARPALVGAVQQRFSIGARFEGVIQFGLTLFVALVSL